MRSKSEREPPTVAPIIAAHGFWFTAGGGIPSNGGNGTATPEDSGECGGSGRSQRWKTP